MPTCHRDHQKPFEFYCFSAWAGSITSVGRGDPRLRLRDPILSDYYFSEPPILRHIVALTDYYFSGLGLSLSLGLGLGLLWAGRQAGGRAGRQAHFRRAQRAGFWEFRDIESVQIPEIP